MISQELKDTLDFIEEAHRKLRVNGTRHKCPKAKKAREEYLKLAEQAFKIAKLKAGADG